MVFAIFLMISLWFILRSLGAAFLGGRMIDADCRRGGLITVSRLLAAGLSAAEALATNKIYRAVQAQSRFFIIY